jgi:hypothetical protein
MDDFPTINDRIHLQPQRLSGATTIFIGLYRIKQFFETTSPHFSPIDFFLGLRQFGGLLEMLEASNRVY